MSRRDGPRVVGRSPCTRGFDPSPGAPGRRRLPSRATSRTRAPSRSILARRARAKQSASSAVAPLASRPSRSWASVIDNVVVGLVAVRYTPWNRRAEVEHLYVTRSARGRGVGRTLMQAACAEARRAGARYVFVETQTLNYPAIRFYERLGFTWCGLDVTLYDPVGVLAGETAVYFARPVE
jgi:ribosomal protein S18 acetylase RimI-like enzyme